MRIPSSGTTRMVLVALAFLSLVPLIRMLGGGLWEPWELHRAEAARQVAAGEVPAWSLPEIEGEGERPPLATWVTAAGFTVGGSEVGNGKIAVAFFLLACAIAALFVLRPLLTLERGLAAFAVFFALPLVFFQGASAGGDAVAFGAYAVAFAGLTRLLELPGASAGPAGERRDLIVGGAASLVGLLLTYFALGAVLGLMVPVGSTAIAVAIGGGMNPRREAGKSAVGPTGVTLRWLAAVAALALLAWFVFAGLLHKPVEETERFSLAVGGAKLMLPLESFDTLLSRYAYALFPWCAFLPLALAWVLIPRNGASAAAGEGAGGPSAESGLLGKHAAVHLLVAYALLAYWHWRYYPAPAIFVFPLALLVGDYLYAALREGRGLRLAGAVTVILVVIVVRDAFAFQKEFLAIIGFPKPGDVVTETPHFPMLLAMAVAAFVALLLLTHLLPSGGGNDVFGWYRRQWSGWREAWTTLTGRDKGRRVAALGTLAPWVIGIVLWAALLVSVYVARYTEATPYTVSHLGFKALLVLAAVPFVVLFLDAGWRVVKLTAAVATPVLRGAVAVTGGLAVSLVVGLVVAPSLDAQFSLDPAARAAAAEGNLQGRLYLLQVEPAATRYYPSLAGGKIVASIDDAVTWLAAAPAGQPRFLVLPSKNAVLNEVNQKYRDKRNGQLLPVISDPAGRYLLAVSELAPGEVNRSPLARVILLERPHPRYPVLEGNFDNKVKYLGYDLTSYPDGTVAALQNVTITHYWECIGKLTGDYKVFVHIDGMGDRINADHDPAEGLYPTRYWRPGDIVVDRQELRIPFFVRPSMRPDAYQIYIGLFRGESRMPMVEGEGNDNRLYGGVLRVR